jgi:peptidoglycan/LPS O-acetylase OafA/YrhL
MFLVHFALGVWLALILSENKSLRVSRWAVLLCLMGLVFSRLAVMILYTGAPQTLDFEYHFPTSALLEGLFSAGLIMAIVTSTPKASALQHPLLVWLGNISYGIYLLHVPSVFLSARLMDVAGMNAGLLRAVLLVAVAVVITLVAAQLMYLLVEKPFNTFGRRLALPYAAKAVAATTP